MLEMPLSHRDSRKGRGAKLRQRRPTYRSELQSGCSYGGPGSVQDRLVATDDRAKVHLKGRTG